MLVCVLALAAGSVLPVRANDAEDFTRRGIYFWRHGDLPQAKQWFDKACQTGPPIAAAFYGSGLVAMKTRDYKKAIQYLDRAIQLDPRLGSAYMDRGATLCSLHEYERAIKDFNKGIEITPTNKDNYRHRAEAYRALKQFKPAVADYDKALSLDPNYAVGYNNRAVIESQTGDLRSALADHDRAISLGLRNAISYASRGWVYYRLKDYSHAMSDFTQALQIDKKFPSAHGGVGAVHLEQGKREEALAEFSKAITLDPSNQWYYKQRAKCYYHMHKFTEALQDYSTAVKLDPKDNDALTGRAESYEALHKYDQAKRDFDNLVIMDSGNAVDLLRHADLLAKTGHYAEAVKDYDRIIQSEQRKHKGQWTGQMVGATIYRADAKMHLGMYREAQADLTSVLKLPNSIVDEGDRAYATTTLDECNHALAMEPSNPTGGATKVGVAGDYMMMNDKRVDELDGLFAHRLVTKHFLFLSDLPEDKLKFYATFAEGFWQMLNDKYFHLADSPVSRVYVLKTHSQFIDFVKSYFPKSSDPDGVFWHAKETIAISGDRNIGEFAHELVHKAVYENLPHIESWAIEGLPCFFEKFYGYLNGKELIAKCGFQSESRIRYFGPRTLRLRLARLIAVTNDPADWEGEERLLAMFVFDRGRFLHYIELTKANNRKGYSSFIEAAFDKPLPQLQHDWASYLEELQSKKQEFEKLPPTAVFTSKSAYDAFVRQQPILARMLQSTQRP